MSDLYLCYLATLGLTISARVPIYPSAPFPCRMFLQYIAFRMSQSSRISNCNPIYHVTSSTLTHLFNTYTQYTHTHSHNCGRVNCRSLTHSYTHTTLQWITNAILSDTLCFCAGELFIFRTETFELTVCENKTNDKMLTRGPITGSYERATTKCVQCFVIYMKNAFLTSRHLHIKVSRICITERARQI